MELYKIIAYCNNDSESYTFDHIPENFEGVKVLQNFNWTNPMGYTPKFSVSTMKAIIDDKVWLDAIFDFYRIESDVEIAIYKLNDDGDDYELLSTFAIDFETYNKDNDFSEFALKPISVLDHYNLIKNTEVKYIATHSATIPTTKNYINIISLQRKYENLIDTNSVLLYFERNEDSKVYNSDSALYESTTGFNRSTKVYEFNRTAPGTTTIAVAGSGIIDLTYMDTGLAMNVYVKLYKNDFNTPIFTIHEEEIEGDGHNILTINCPKTKVEDAAYADGDFYFIAITTDTVTTEFYTCTGDFFVDLYVETEVVANKYGRYLRYTTAETLLNAFFDNNATIEAELKPIGVVSAGQIVNSFDYLTIKPKEFLNDFCIATGSLVNFNVDGSVNIAKINTYFPALLNVANAVTVSDFKNLKIGYDMGLNFASLTAGMTPQQYEIYTYFLDWNKIISFSQTGRNASEDLGLVLSKFRVDFSGILDTIQKISTKSSGEAKDLYIFDPAFTDRGASEPHVYDRFTPRDIIKNWYQFLIYCFETKTLQSLVLLSNGGTPDNLLLDSDYQLDDVPFYGDTAKILPLKVEFTGLIEETDFTEKILKITNNGTEMYIFVTEAETTDNLSEQKIKGNLIYFPI